MNNREFNSNLKAISDSLMAFAYRLTRNTTDAQDLYQDTVMKAFLHQHQYNDLNKFKSWIATIMHNTFVTQYRKKKRRREILEKSGDTISCFNRHTCQPDADSKFFYDEVREMVRSLGEVSGKTIMMYAKGYSYEEISQQMKIPIGTVKSRINFARRKLETKMTTLYPEGSQVRVA